MGSIAIPGREHFSDENVVRVHASAREESEVIGKGATDKRRYGVRGDME
jgi:hypothetical protein